jgi:NDP-sugar pyrophosphorylase family protein
MCNKAVILAGGKGTRLAPYTTVFPKPLVPLGHRPILEIITLQLIHYGITNIVLSLGYLGELIQAYFQNAGGHFANLDMTYVKEQKPLGTAGSLRLIPQFDDTCIVMNGDILTTMDYTRLVKYHHAQGGILTIGMLRKPVNIDLGVIESNPDGAITAYIEKPVHHYNVSMGIYVYEPEVLKYIEPDTYLDFPDLVCRLLANKEKVFGYSSKDFWLDIGRHEDYALAQQEFDAMREQFLPQPSVDHSNGNNYVDRLTV